MALSIRADVCDQDELGCQFCLQMAAKTYANCDNSINIHTHTYDKKGKLSFTFSLSQIQKYKQTKAKQINLQDIKKLLRIYTNKQTNKQD